MERCREERRATDDEPESAGFCGSGRSQGRDCGAELELLSYGSGEGAGRDSIGGGGRERDSAGGGREAGLGLGGIGGAEELLERAARRGLPLQSLSRSEEECEVRRGGRGEQESARRRLRFRLGTPGPGLPQRPEGVESGRTFREWEKERREWEVLGLAASGCSFSVMVDL